jgi:biopolymer transport protein ExbB/TolQ
MAVERAPIVGTGRLRRSLPRESLYQVFSLIIIVIVVQAFYATIVRPNANAVIAEQALRQEQETNYTPKISFWVVIKDYEQESELIFGFWAFAIMAYKAAAILRERSLLQRELLPIHEGVKVLPEDTREYARAIQSLPERVRSMLVPRALLAALDRFGSTRNVQDVSSTANAACDTEGERLESELAMIRYIAWAIPSLGFIGTVRGIGQALSEAHRAVLGDISGVTANLGLAFNSTLVALLISMVLMFVVHQLQLMQERFVLDTQNYVERNLIRHMHSRGAG